MWFWIEKFWFEQKAILRFCILIAYEQKYSSEFVAIEYIKRSFEECSCNNAGQKVDATK